MLGVGGFKGVAEIGAVGPLLQDDANGGLELLAGGIGTQLGEGGGQFVGLAGGFAQIAHGAAALHVGQISHGAGVETVGNLTVESVVGEVDIGQPRGGAGAAGSVVGAGIGALPNRSYISAIKSS